MKNCIKKSLKANNGITLIALVITIIVLLILAGISISMLSGDNGILQRATDAKTKTERQSVVEQAKTDILGYQVENKETDLQKSQLKSVLDTYFKSVPDLTDMSDSEILNTELETLAKYGTYTITVNEIFNGNFSGNNQLQTATADEINAKIGTVVSGYSAKDLEWQIYYADEYETFLISKTLAKENNVIPTNLENTKDIKNLSYGLKWNLKWIEKRERETVSGYYENAFAAAFLCDPDNWTGYKISPATYAVGGPTLELLIASWNASQNANIIIPDEYISALKGYMIAGPDELNALQLTADINNGVYCDGNGVYLLGSPSCNGDYFDGSFLRSVNSTGVVTECMIGTSYYHGQGGCRPIVSIPTSKININGNTVTVLP